MLVAVVVRAVEAAAAVAVEDNRSRSRDIHSVAEEVDVHKAVGFVVVAAAR